MVVWGDRIVLLYELMMLTYTEGGFGELVPLQVRVEDVTPKLDGWWLDHEYVLNSSLYAAASAWEPSPGYFNPEAFTGPSMVGIDLTPLSDDLAILWVKYRGGSDVARGIAGIGAFPLRSDGTVGEYWDLGGHSGWFDVVPWSQHYGMNVQVMWDNVESDGYSGEYRPMAYVTADNVKLLGFDTGPIILTVTRDGITSTGDDRSDRDTLAPPSPMYVKGNIPSRTVQWSSSVGDMVVALGPSGQGLLAIDSNNVEWPVDEGADVSPLFGAPIVLESGGLFWVGFDSEGVLTGVERGSDADAAFSKAAIVNSFPIYQFERVSAAPFVNNAASSGYIALEVVLNDFGPDGPDIGDGEDGGPLAGLAARRTAARSLEEVFKYSVTFSTWVNVIAWPSGELLGEWLPVGSFALTVHVEHAEAS